MNGKEMRLLKLLSSSSWCPMRYMCFHVILDCFKTISENSSFTMFSLLGIKLECYAFSVELIIFEP